MAVDPRCPCIVGVATRTWHPADLAGADAPEPLAMWEEVARSAAADSGCPGLLRGIESLQVVYCETWQYDDPVARLAQRLGAAPRLRHYSGIGGTTPQVLIGEAATSILAGDLDLALVTSAEALATRRRHLKAGQPYERSFPPERPRDYPWDDPLHPSEIAHGAFEAWLDFALFDNARRAHLGTGLDDYRRAIGRVMAPLTQVAASNPDAWFRVARSADDLITPSPDNRMVGYPYTKYLVAVMDVDMAAAVVVASNEKADALGIPADRRVYLRSWAGARDPVFIGARRDLWRSSAMGHAARAATAGAGIDVDEVARFDLYSCFASSLHFARDALGLDAHEARPLTVTGGLPYHGGPGSGYVTHAIAQMARELRADPGSLGLVSGVGMFMTKHVFATYSTEPGRIVPPDGAAIQAAVDAERPVEVEGEHDGDAAVAAYCVVHGRQGGPEWGLLVCDLPDGRRCYARAEDPHLLADAEQRELVGEVVRLTPRTAQTLAGEARLNIATR